MKGGDPAYIQKRKDAYREQRERQQQENQVEIIRALDRISNQLATDEQQEQRDHRKKAFREWATIILIFATVITAGIGDVIFYNTMKDARNSLTESERAWAGPQNAKIDGSIEIGKPVAVVIAVQNSGKEPAKDFTYAAMPFTFDLNQSGGISLNDTIKNLVDGCFLTAPLKRAQVLYPTNGFGSGFEFRTEFPKELIDQAVIDGTKTLVIAGCLSYTTFDRVKHSAFCYFYNAKSTKNPTTALNLCTGASEAD